MKNSYCHIGKNHEVDFVARWDPVLLFCYAGPCLESCTLSLNCFFQIIKTLGACELAW